MKLSVTLSLLCAFALGGDAVAAAAPPQQFENAEFLQTYDITGPYIRKSIKLDIKNIGKDDATEYYFASPSDEAAHIAIMEGQQDRVPLTIDLNALVDGNVTYHRIHLAKALAPGDRSLIALAQAVTEQIVPVPEYANQGDEQFVVYEGARMPLSAYKTSTATTRVRPPGFQLQEENDSGAEPGTDSGMLVYGPYKNIAPLSAPGSFHVRYMNPRPLPKFTLLQRAAWVSHWGASLSFDETYWLKNIGTKLRDTFSRVDMMRSGQQPNLNAAAIKDLVFGLPGEGRESYHVDLVGMVSTSKFKSGKRDSSLTIHPRYPVFGGWNYNFTIGWSHDLAQFVREIGDREYLIRLPLLNGPDLVSYDTVELSVILPEGADDIQVVAPGEPVSSELERTFSYLDTAGRPTVRLQYQNLVDGHRHKEILIRYHYSLASALRKPASVAAAIAAVFTIGVLVSKINISVSKRRSS